MPDLYRCVVGRTDKPSDRIVLTTSLDPFLALRPGAARCLTLLRSLAGHARMFSTRTQSLATLLGRCPNTVRTYRDQLVAAGYIWWTTNPRTGITMVLIRTAVEAPSRQAALDGEGGAQFCAPIKPRKNLSYPKPTLYPRARVAVPQFRTVFEPHPPVRTVAEQIAAIMGG